MLNPDHQCVPGDCYDLVIKVRMHKKHSTAVRQDPAAVLLQLREVIEDAGPELYVCDNQHDRETTYVMDSDLQGEVASACPWHEACDMSWHMKPDSTR